MSLKMRLLLAAVLLVPALALAQPYPNRTIRFIVPFPPGSNLDFVARTLQPKLTDALGKALADPEVRERFATQGLEAASSTPEQFAAHIRSEVEKWIRVAKSAN